MKRGFGLAAAAPVVFVAWMSVALAQSTGGSTNITLCDPLGNNCQPGNETFLSLANNVIGFIFWDIATPLSVIMVLVGAFQLMTSGGNPEKASQGRKTIMYAAIGLAVAIAASGLATFIKSLLNGS